jgi:hypothetical protein
LEIKKMAAWQIVKEWDEQKRYKNPAQSTRSDAITMLVAVEKLVEMLLCINLYEQ